MALYEYSWLILLSPIFAFAVILFGTRMWDLATRGRIAAKAAHETEAHVGHDGHEEPDGPDELIHEKGPRGEDVVFEDWEDPKVPQLTMGAKVSGYLSVIIMALACIYSWILLLNTAGLISVAPQLPTQGISLSQISYPWCQNIDATNNCFGLGSYVIAFHLDRLTIPMLVVVTSITLLVQFYSQGYMERSAGYARFFAYLSLFAFSMLTIVFAANFLVIFIGWELVGLSSYLLIGFWFNKKSKPAEDRLSPASASVEAFIVNRVGDVGFIIGIMILFVNTGTFNFSQLPAAVTHMDKTLLTVAMILVFCGAIGKSAQVPLHVWLPPAMEGPTPVSALIHAATMVAAGVYMVGRTWFIFAAADPLAFQVVAWIGGISAIFAAVIALVQTDFKRVLAFSTISQLGYMFVGMGIAAGTAYGPGLGLFHLFTHAFFKALLFLCAGSVLFALHHATHKETQDMRVMGGLGPLMPITAIAWLVGTLSIGGFPFFDSFFSKDNIIAEAYRTGNYGLWAVTLITAGLTSFYMFRAFILAFGGKGGRLGGMWGGTYRGKIYRIAGLEEGNQDKTYLVEMSPEEKEHIKVPHESPLVMTIPLIILMIPSIFAGDWFNFYPYIQAGAPALTVRDVLDDWLTWVGLAVSLIGFTWAFVLYARFEFASVHDYVENRAFLRTAHRILLHKFYVDDLYNWIIKYIVLGLSHIAQAFDTYVVDGIVNGVARLITVLGRDVRHVETGRVQTYMIGFFGGVAVLAILVFALVAFVK
ncbi:MAG TPA: NADH-quinone oxidoreductase subunit L [Ktedonobacteraceae bacterium]|nr:NADH-quinone oxidoreductase subunit L [Ktedonobacteraceae bacterium]